MKFYFLLLQLSKRPGRVFLSGLGIALGVALFLSIQLINQSTLQSFRENVAAVAGETKLSISGGDAGFSESWIERVERIPDVRAVVPVVENRAYFMLSDGKTETLHILGIDLLKDKSVRSYRTTDEMIIDDPLVFLNQADSIILTREFAKAHRFAIDSKMDLMTAHGKKQFTVRGLLMPTGPAKAFGGAIAIMDIDAARVTFGKEGKVDRLDLVTTDDANPEQVAANLRQRLGDGFLVDRPQTQSESLARMVKSFQGMLSFLSLTALIVGLFLVANSVNVSVAERRKEIGTLRAIGARRGRILRLILIENALIGAFSSAIGVAAGWMLARSLLGVATKALNAQFTAQFNVSRIYFETSDVIAGIALGTLTCLVAAFLPAYRATLIAPIEALQPQEISSVSKPSVFWKISPWAGALLLIYLGFAAWTGWGKDLKTLESIHTLLGILGAAFLAPLLVLGLMSQLRRWIDFEKNSVLRVGLENLLRNRSRTASNTLTLIVGLLLVVIISCVTSSFRWSIERWFTRMISQSDLMISSSGRWTQLQMQPLHQDLARQLEKIPGIASRNEGGILGVRIVKIGYEGRILALKGFEEPPKIEQYGFIDAVSASSEELGRKMYAKTSPIPVVLISENMVSAFGKRPGDTLKLGTPQGSQDFLIGGTMQDFVNPEGVIYMSRANYQRFWKDPLLDFFTIRVAPGFSADQVRMNIDATLGKTNGISTLKSAEAIDDIRRSVDENMSFNYAIEIAALAVGLIGLLNTMLISVMERTREIATLRAIGMKRPEVALMTLLECFLIGSVGALAASALGSYISFIWVKSSLSHILGWTLQFYFPWITIGAALLAGLWVAVLAGILPALRATRIPLSEALRAE